MSLAVIGTLVGLLERAKRQWRIRCSGLRATGFCKGGMQKSPFEVFVAMSSCSAPGCKLTVPAALEADKLCILHFTMEIERRCAEMRRGDY
jgi:hypothetical protein